MSAPAPATPLYWVRQRLADVALGDDWLAAAEHAHLATLRVPKRRADWRLGRWTSKRVVTRLAGDGELRRIAILADADGAPAAWRDGVRLPLTVSISHAAGHGFCVAAPVPCALGCDIEAVAERSAAFVRDYFTPAEQAALAGADACQRAAVATLLWSAKEAALKALREGLRLDTRALEVTLQSGAPLDAWQAMTVVFRDANQRFAGWWRREDDVVLTVASSLPLGAPRELVLG